MENIEDRLSQSLVERFNICGSYERLPVIISYDVPFSLRQKGILSESMNYNRLTRSLRCIQSVACSLDICQLMKVLKNDHIVHAEYDSSTRCSLNSARYWSEVDRAVRDFRLTGSTLHYHCGTGEGVVAAVVDTGVDCCHVDMTGRIIAWKNLLGCERVPYDKNGHGTHSSSIIVGGGIANHLYRGVAPGASLVCIKALDDKGNGRLSDLVSAIDWVIENQEVYGIRIINLSLDTDGSSDGNDAGSRAADKAVENSMTVFAAAGNGGPGTYTIGSPAASRRAITVGAMADMGEKGIYLADFSSRGPTADNRIKPDITAPGVNISAPCTGSLFGYNRLSGTSSAAPFAAGIAALMLEANPSLTPDDIKAILISSCSKWGPSSPNADYGYGLVNAYKALKQCSSIKAKNAIPSPLLSSIPDQINERRLYQSYYDFKASCGSYSGIWSPAELCERDYTRKTSNYHIYNSQIPSCNESCKRPGHFHGSGSLSGSGAKDLWRFNVYSTVYPVAITFIITNWVSGYSNLDLNLYSPSGKKIASSQSFTRQESIAVHPQERGLYTMEVTSSCRSCSYYFDISLSGENSIKIEAYFNLNSKKFLLK